MKFNPFKMNDLFAKLSVVSVVHRLRHPWSSRRLSALLCLSALSFFFPLFRGTDTLVCAAQTQPPKQVPSYRIAGKIVDASTNLPLPGAELSFTEASAEMKITSDEQGRFLFAGLDPGKYTLMASAPGYVTESYNQRSHYSTAIVVGPALDSEHLLVRLHRQAVITGTVTDEHGEPVRDAQVLLFIQERAGKRLVSVTPTNDLGAYRFASLQAGNYFVAVSARPWYAQAAFRGGLPSSTSTFNDGAVVHSYSRPRQSVDPRLDVVYPITFFPGLSDEHSAGELILTPGDTQEADVRLQAVPSLHIRVTNLPSSQPYGVGENFAATRKVFDSFDFGVSMSVVRISSDVLEISGLPPGEISLNFNSTQNGGTESRTIPVNVNEGESIDASGTASAASVSGKILAADGAAHLQGSVTLAGRDGRSFDKTMEKDGSFSFPHVEPGTYEVQVNLGGEDYVRELTAAGAKVAGQDVKIDGSEEVRLLVRMGRGFGQVKGVVQADGKPYPGAMVLLIPTFGESLEKYSRMDQSDSDGSFALERILPGKYLLMAIDDWDLDWQDSAALAPYRAKAQSLTVAPSETKTTQIQLLTASVAVKSTR